MDWLHELRLGVRAWARRPGLAVVIVATLGIGIGANVAVFTVVDGVLLQPFPYASELYGVSATDPATFAVIPTTLAVVALVAAYVTAHRASRLNVSSSLRNE